MADNVQFQSTTIASPPASTLVATDDCAGAAVQIFKQAISADGDATLIPADETDGLLVNLGANNDVAVTGTVTTKETRSATGTTSQVADTASSTTILASNANRLGASVQNDSSAALYLKCGTTASTTDYTVRLSQYDYWEVPFGYTGRIDGIWASDPGDGGARVTEYT